ncbi:uncharacterized protein TNCV_3893221 [Trichonephila clavipes]|nr:uncharacterized protein TNCV_3893221 [Trichonephila clavipes]
MFVLATVDVNSDYVEEKTEEKMMQTKKTTPKTFIEFPEKEKALHSGKFGIICGIFQLMVSVSIALVTSYLLRTET